MKFSDLSKYLEKLEKTDSRLEMTEILSDLFKKTDGKSIDKVVYLILGQLAPGYKQIVFNIAEKMALNIVSRVGGKNIKKIRSQYKEVGDLGEVIQKNTKELKRKGLSVESVFNNLHDIAKDEGEGSQERKIDKSVSLIRSLDPLSAKYALRIILGKLRLGFSDKTILDALSWFEKGDKSLKSQLEAAYNVYPDVGFIAKKVKQEKIEKAIKGIKPSLSVPLLPALAQRLKSPSEMIDKMGKVFVEPKFDGLRIQIHFKKDGFKLNGFVQNNGKVLAFTRNLNETSWMFPELKTIGSQINAKEVIIDTEAIGVDEARKSLANFQTTMTRRRKHDIKKTQKKVKIKFFVFDILYKDNKSLIDEKFFKRRQVLKKTIKGKGVLEVVESLVTSNPKEIEKGMKKYLSLGLEGIIVKKFDSKYVAGRTGWRWVKMKEEEGKKAKLSDTIDGVVMGYYKGRGKRAKFGIGGFLVGVKKGEEIRTLSKIGTGLTDDQFKEIKEQLEKIEIKSKPKEYQGVNKTLAPDVWVLPKLVVEIAADEITKSPIHSSGYALRFPRLVRIRGDKSKNQTTTISELKGIGGL